MPNLVSIHCKLKSKAEPNGVKQGGKRVKLLCPKRWIWLSGSYKFGVTVNRSHLHCYLIIIFLIKLIFPQ